jgi:hypothetical protein
LLKLKTYFNPIHKKLFVFETKEGEKYFKAKKVLKTEKHINNPGCVWLEM